MRLLVLAVGRMKAGPERDLLRRYQDRAEALGRSMGFAPLQLVEIEESRARTTDERRRDEAAALDARAPAGAAIVLLDETGEPISSQQMADLMASPRDVGAPALVFAIGGPDGFDPAWRLRHKRIAFGRVTFPHQIVRVLLTEQIYRAMTILGGHPYHRA